MCLEHLNWRDWGRETGLSPPVKIFLLAVPRQCFFCGSYLLVMFHVGVCCAVVFVPCSLVVGHLLGKDFPHGCRVCCFCHIPICVLVHIRIKAEVGVQELV